MLCERIVATRTVCAESSLVLVSGRPDLGDKNKAALGSQGALSHYSFYRADWEPEAPTGRHDLGVFWGCPAAL